MPAPFRAKCSKSSSREASGTTPSPTARVRNSWRFGPAARNSLWMIDAKPPQAVPSSTVTILAILAAREKNQLAVQGLDITDVDDGCLNAIQAGQSFSRFHGAIHQRAHGQDQDMVATAQHFGLALGNFDQLLIQRHSLPRLFGITDKNRLGQRLPVKTMCWSSFSSFGAMSTISGTGSSRAISYSPW